MSKVSQLRRFKVEQVKEITIANEQVFLNLYAGFLGGGNNAKDKRKEFGSAGQIARLERRIRNKMHEISVDNSPENGKFPAGAIPSRKLKELPEGGFKVAFTVDEFKMLETYLNSIEWLTSGCDEVAALFDVMDGAVTRDA